MDNNNNSLKRTEIENTKKEIIELRIKNKFYDQNSVIDKVINEILNEEFHIQNKRNKSPFSGSQ